MNRHHDQARRSRSATDEAHRDALVDALWLGGEAIVAPACRGMEDPRRNGDDCAEPDWQVL